jgi:carbamoyltransferase
VCSSDLCVSGGYGMNIVANHYYLQRFPDVEFYFEPIADDTGGAIGSAKMFWYFETKDKTIRPLKTTSFHGVHYDISSYKGKTTSIKDIAKLLYQDKSVAVYTGLAEAGQRALGNRSILFNALNPDAKDLVNKIKKREWYRPFACMVLEEDANIYFDMEKIKSSPFMTICFPVNVKIIPGVTHIDNTCRIQTVSKEDKYLYELLNEFKKLSGHGIVLNTSFNLAGEPLVETPEDAFNTLNNSCLDYLWFEETQQLFKNKKSMSLGYS